MNHENFENALLLRAAGELAPEQAAGLEAHLPACSSCRAFSAALESCSAAARLTLEEPPSDLVRRTRATILEARTPRAWSFPWSWAPTGLGLALATLLLLVGRKQREPAVAPRPEAPLAAEDRDDLSQAEADLDELEELISDAELDLSDNVTGGDL